MTWRPDNDRARVVYLAGSGHTGSTLLALLMDAHPSIASVGEIAIKPKIRHKGNEGRQKCSCGALVGECEFWRSIFQRVNEHGFEFGPENWTNDYRLTHPLLHRVFTRESSYPLLRTLRDWAERHVPPYRRRIRRIDRVNVAFVRAVLETAHAEVFFDTSKGAIRLTRLLKIPEFDLRVVTLVRDVRAYAASAKKRAKTVPEAARTWKEDRLAIRNVMSTLSPDRTMLIRYEDLCTDPTLALGRLWDFCGVARIDPPSRLYSDEHHVLGNNMRLAGPIEVKLDERWRQNLDPAEEAQALQIAGDLNQEFGYLP